MTTGTYLLEALSVSEVLVLDQYRLPRRLASLLLRVLRRLPGRRPQAMTMLAVARRVFS